MKRILGLVVALGLVMSCAMQRPATAQNAGPLSLPFSLTAAGQRTPTISFNGPMSSCSVVVTGGSSFTLVPQAASDGTNNPNPSWVTATTINSGSITSVGTYTGQIATIGLTSFGALLTTYSSGTITGTVTCSGAIASLPGSVGPSGPPGPTGSPGPAGSGFTNLVCTGNVVCSPSAGPTPAVTNTNAPTYTGQVAAAGFGQNSANAWAGSCTGSTTAPTCTATIGTTFTTPLCLAQDTNQNAGGVDVVCSVSGTTVTVQALSKTLVGTCTMVAATTCTGSITYKMASTSCLTQPTVASITVSGACADSTSTTTVTANVNNSLVWTFFVSGTPEVAHVYEFVVFGNPS